MIKNNSYIEQFLLFKKVLVRFLILYIALAVGVFFLFNDVIYKFFSDPLFKTLINYKGQIIATKLDSTVVVPLKLSLFVTFIFSLPVFIIDLWFFIKPALYEKEKFFLKVILIISLLLFYLSLTFCFFTVYPLVINFFILFAPKNLELMIDVNYFLEMLMGLFLAFIVAFQLPNLILLLIKFKIVKIRKLTSIRPYFIVIAFIVGALLTPPDVISQIMLAVPIIILYEAGILLAKFLKI
jgi:sec-independent protein translocase protein TatC